MWKIDLFRNSILSFFPWDVSNVIIKSAFLVPINNGNSILIEDDLIMESPTICILLHMFSENWKVNILTSKWTKKPLQMILTSVMRGKRKMWWQWSSTAEPPPPSDQHFVVNTSGVSDFSAWMSYSKLQNSTSLSTQISSSIKLKLNVLRLWQIRTRYS